MATLVLTVIGDDRSGLVSALAKVVADHGGSWQQSQMARLGGKFAGIVLVAAPDEGVAGLTEALQSLSAEGLLDVAVTPSGRVADPYPGTRMSLQLIGQDRPGIVREVSAALASHGVSIEELTTATSEAPQAGGMLFEARATLLMPAGVGSGELQSTLEAIAHELMVDIDLAAT